MNSIKTFFFAFVSATCFAGSAQATVIDFEGLPSGVAANPLVLGGATFETLAGFNYIVSPGFQSTELCPSISPANPANCSRDLSVVFDAPASNISFEFAANNEQSIGADIGDVRIFSGATLLGTVDVIVRDASGVTHDLVQLGGFSGVTRLLISSTDLGGVVYDNFVFNARSVPEPASLALLGLGLVGFGFGRRKKA